MGTVPRGRTSTLLSQQGLGVRRGTQGARGSPGCRTPSLEPWEKLRCQHRQEVGAGQRCLT